MIRIVVPSLFALSGCSFFRANCANDPAQACSKKTQYVDYAIAGAGVGGAAAAYLVPRCDNEYCDRTTTLFVVALPALVLAVTAIASSVYGDSVTERCERLTTTSSGRPVRSPAASAP